MGKSSRRVNLTDSTAPHKKHTKTATPVTSTKSARPVKHTKQATRVYNLSKANNDLVDEVVSLRDRVNELETREQERTLGEVISGLKAAIASLETACTIERYAEMSNEMIQENFDAIKAKLEALEAMSSTIQSQNSELLNQVSNVSANAGGGGSEAPMKSKMQTVTHTTYMSYRQDSNSRTYGNASQRSYSKVDDGYRGWCTFSRSGYFYNQTYSYRRWSVYVYSIIKFSIPADVRANWAGITGVTAKVTVGTIPAHYGSLYLIDPTKLDGVDQSMTTTGTRSSVQPNNTRLDGTGIASGSGVFTGEWSLPKEYFAVTDIDNQEYLELMVYVSQSRKLTSSSGSTSTDGDSYYIPQMGILGSGVVMGPHVSATTDDFDTELIFDTTPLS